MERLDQLGSSPVKGKDLKKVPKPLVVYEAVIRFGPISHDELYQKVGFSRSATFRALRHLETAGWVRRLINNHQYVATAHVDELVSSGSTSLIELDEISSALSCLNFGYGFKFNVGFYVTKKTFCILESSSKFEPLNSIRYPIESCAALVAYCYHYQGWDEKILFDPNFICNDYDRAVMRTRLLNCRRDLNRRGFYFCANEFCASIGVKVNSTLVGSITLRNKNMHKASDRAFVSNIRMIQSIMGKRGFLANL